MPKPTDFLVARANHTGTQAPATISPQGAGSGFDADTVDGSNPVAVSGSTPVDADAAAADAGVAATASRSDHKHSIPVANVLDVHPTANSAGSATTLARSDHRHFHGDLPGGTLHGEATASVAGFLPAADKAKIDKLRIITSGSTSVGAASTVDLATFSRNANERITILGYVTENVASLEFGQSLGVGAGDRVAFFLERTANANEMKARATNTNVSTARTLEWVILGVTP